MSDPPALENDFLGKITKIVGENISNEQFGVSELASEIGMSRSNLLRKIKKSTSLSASQFIRQVRLESAMEFLKQGTLNVSEVSYNIGFSSTSYFIKCFHDHYGYPPGEVGKRAQIADTLADEPLSDNKELRAVRKWSRIRWAFLIIVSIIIGYLVLTTNFREIAKLFIPTHAETADKKSIAVLPFINDSDDSTNVYIVNGLMESILNNLQKIEDLRVISRTSVEKYRNNPKTISEIAQELDVDYFIEGSGQKIGDEILLNIQLIDAPTDKHLWAQQYSREAKDIFSLQREVAKNIADKIHVIITPEEEQRIDKVPTVNLEAYDYFLKGLDYFYKGNREGLVEAIAYFEKAIEHDNKFARAYADIAISYYYMDIYQTEKQYSDKIRNYADKAFLLDPDLEQSLIAKAVHYMHNAEYELAVSYFEKALENNPNSALVINILSDFYTNYVPNTEKYLEYALKGVSIDIAANDSTTVSFIYLHLSNAFIQSGFVAEAENYINKSLKYNPENIYSHYVKAYILYAKDADLEQTKELLITTLKKDTTRLDVLQEVGKTYYYLRDFDSSYYYYGKFIGIKEALNLDLFKSENAKIAIVLSKVGQNDKSKKYLSNYKNYADNDKSIYKHLSLAMYYSQKGDTKNAIEQMRLFAQQDNYNYWAILFLPIDPLIDNIVGLSEFKEIFTEIESKFWNNHKRIKASLEEKGVL
mgnify:CR=1 FL=1